MTTQMRVARDGVPINPGRLLNTMNRKGTTEWDPDSVPSVIVGIGNLQILAQVLEIARADPRERWKLAHAEEDALRLSASGCHIDGSAHHGDCALACVRPDELFQSLGTLSNCVTLSAASLFVKGKLYRKVIFLPQYKTSTDLLSCRPSFNALLRPVGRKASVFAPRSCSLLPRVATSN